MSNLKLLATVAPDAANSPFRDPKSGWVVTQYITKDLVTVDQIKEAILAHLAITEDIFLNRVRTRRISDARFLYCYFSRLLTTKNLAEINSGVHYKDHTSVLHGIRKIAQFIEVNDPQLMPVFQAISTYLKHIQCQQALLCGRPIYS